MLYQRFVQRNQTLDQKAISVPAPRLAVKDLWHLMIALSAGSEHKNAE